MSRSFGGFGRPARRAIISVGGIAEDIVIETGPTMGDEPARSESALVSQGIVGTDAPNHSEGVTISNV